MGFLLQILIMIATQVISYLITPKPKQQTSAAVRDLQAPTAEAGRPIPVVFGSITVKGGNILHYSDVSTKSYKVN